MDWSGRIDGEESDVLRVHQIVKQMDLEKLLEEQETGKKVCFVSFNSDEGIIRNKGRIGAKDGWRELKHNLSSFPVLEDEIQFYDLEIPIEIEDNNLEKAQEELSEIVKKLKEKNYLVVVLGGGHEIAYGTFTGIKKYGKSKEESPKIGIVNIDAHFDMRDYDKGCTSGSMFLQIADDCKKENLKFNYNVFGIQKFSNTRRLFNKAETLGVNYVLASEMADVNPDNVYKILSENDYIHLTICTDVFRITDAPGVSAPQPFGIDPRVGMKVIKTVCKHSKNLTVDVAEVNPKYDYDSRTSRLMSNIIYEIILSHYSTF